MLNFRVHRAENFGVIMNPMLDAPPQLDGYTWGDREKEEPEPFMTFEPTPMRVRLEGAKKSKPAGRSKAEKAKPTPKAAPAKKERSQRGTGKSAT